MSNVPDPPPGKFPSPSAALLSFLVPGLGQIVQGRVGKGVLFMLCIYSLFFYGVTLGSGRNVYLPQANRLPDPGLLAVIKGVPLAIPKPLGIRPQFLGQFWMGVVVWPAIYQFYFYDEEAAPPDDPWLGRFQRTPTEAELNELQTKGDKTWDLGWVFTVIAGVLNVLVIYDAFAGPAFTLADPGRKPDAEAPKPEPEAVKAVTP